MPKLIAKQAHHPRSLIVQFDFVGPAANYWEPKFLEGAPDV